MTLVPKNGTAEKGPVPFSGAVSPVESLRDPRGFDAVEHFWPALLGELAGPLGHEFNNFLNNVLLEIAVLDGKVPETARSELAAIRRQAARVTGLVHRFQQYLRLRETAVHPVSLNPLICEVTGVWEKVKRAGCSGRPELYLAPDLPPIVTRPGDLQRLLFLLLEHAAGPTASDNHRLRIRSQGLDNGVRLVLENTAAVPELPPEEAFLEKATCKAIAQRLGGKLSFSRPATHVTIVTLELTASEGP